MEVKPGYKQTEVGVIPADWEVRPLDGLASFIHGFAFQSSYFCDSGDYKLTTPGNFCESGGFRELRDKQKYYSGPIPSGYVLSKGDLIVAMTEQADGLLGSAAIIPEDCVYLHNQRLGRLRLESPSISCGYLYRVFNSPIYRRQVRETAAGTKVKHTSPKKLTEIVIPLPPTMAEQEAIAGALSDADALIESLEQLVAKKRQIKHGAMQELLTGQKRLPGFSDEWDVTCLDRLVTRSTGVWGVSEPDDIHQRAVEVIRAGDISQEGMLTSTAERFVTESEFNKSKCEFDDLVITTSGNGLGKVWWCDGRANTIASNFVRVLRPNQSRTNGKCLSYVLRTSHGLRQLQEHTATSAYPNLRPTFFSSVWIPLPGLREQESIAEVLTVMDKEIAALEAKLAKARQVKQGMMQELLTGRIRLIYPGDAAPDRRNPAGKPTVGLR
jgi:type I restriction enzyme S subunit